MLSLSLMHHTSATHLENYMYDLFFVEIFFLTSKVNVLPSTTKVYFFLFNYISWCVFIVVLSLIVIVILVCCMFSVLQAT